MSKRKKNHFILPGVLIGACALAVLWKRGEIKAFIQGQAGQEDSLRTEEVETDIGKTSQETAQILHPDVTRNLEAGSILDISGMDEAAIGALFYGEAIPDAVFERINGVSYQENENISREDLQYLRVLYMGFDGQTHIGELIVNSEIAADVLDIMRELYANAYQIEKMVLIDAYGGDDNASMADNNSSAFNYRVIAGTSKLSKHSLGLAVDINPKYNPYIRTNSEGETVIDPENGVAYADRSKEFDHKIDAEDLACQLFKEHGFTWGGDWNTMKDYQHFQKALD